MEILFALFDGILIALQPMNLGLAILGVVIGLFVGAMPGLGSMNGVAILLRSAAANAFGAAATAVTNS